jgi:hypothetical protein
MASFSKAEKTSKPPIDEMFADVYREPTKHIRKQQAELNAHLKEYGKHYPLDSYKSK